MLPIDNFTKSLQREIHGPVITEENIALGIPCLIFMALIIFFISIAATLLALMPLPELLQDARS